MAEFTTNFKIIGRDNILEMAKEKRDNAWRFVQVHATNTDEGIDVTYSFMKDGLLDNYTVKGLTKEDHIPSITDLFFAAFVFENEVHDLFGVKIDGIAIDFDGHFYALAQPEPMTIMSPEQKAARDKAAKIAKAKAAKEAKAAAEAAQAEAAERKDSTANEASTPAQGDEDGKPTAEDLEAKAQAKMAALDPEKAAKVKAALEARQKKEQEKADAEFEAKLANMDPEKAAKVRAAYEAKKAKKAAEQGGE